MEDADYRLCRLAKWSMMFYPFLGWYMWLADTIFIRRHDRHHAISAINDAAKQIKEKKVSCI